METGSWVGGELTSGRQGWSAWKGPFLPAPSLGPQMVSVQGRPWSGWLRRGRGEAEGQVFLGSGEGTQGPGLKPSSWAAAWKKVCHGVWPRRP